MEIKFKNILIIYAHPDDETLGLGGTVCTLAKNKAKINCLIFTDGESGRGETSKIQKRKEQSIKDRAKYLDSYFEIIVFTTYSICFLFIVGKIGKHKI
jgi:LmbE family N-acetylglucosaminyl deacetylase